MSFSSLRDAFSHPHSLLQCLGQKLQLPEVLRAGRVCCKSQELLQWSLTTACQKTEQGSTKDRRAVQVYLEAGPLHQFLALGLAPQPAFRPVPCQDQYSGGTARKQGPNPTDPKGPPGLAAASQPQSLQAKGTRAGNKQAGAGPSLPARGL